MLQAKASIHIMKCDENNGVDDESIQVAHPDLAQTETFGKQQKRYLYQLKNMLHHHFDSACQEMIDGLLQKARAIRVAKHIDSSWSKLSSSYLIIHLRSLNPNALKKIRSLQLHNPLLEQNLLRQFLQTWNIQRQSECNMWRLHQYTAKNQMLVRQMKTNNNRMDFHQNQGAEQCLLYNSAVCLHRLSKYEQSQLTLQRIRQMQSRCLHIEKLRLQVAQLSLVIDFKMGKLINLEDDRVKVLESEQYLSITKKETVNGCHIKQLLFLVNFMCNDLENFQYKLNLMSKNKIHINTYFNLALLAKKKGLSNHAIALFEGLTKELRKTYVRDQRNQHRYIINLCYVNLAQIYAETENNYSLAIDRLNKIDSSDVKHMSEVREKIIEYSSASLLQAEREKLTPTLLKKGEDKLRVNRRYTLLIEQENLIDQLVGEARFKRINQTSEGCLIPAGNQQKKKDQKMKQQNKKKVNVDLIYKTMISPNLKTPRTLKSTLPSCKLLNLGKSLSKFEQLHLKSDHRENWDMADKMASVFLQYECQIRKGISQQKTEEVLQHIEKLVKEFDVIQQQLDSFNLPQSREVEEKIFQQQLKTLSWYKAIREQLVQGQYRKYISKYTQQQRHIKKRLQLMQDLAKHLVTQQKYKDAIDSYMQLHNLGDTSAICRIAEIHLSRQFYSEAIKYFQKYAELQKDIDSKVRLAHAYSKIPVYVKQAREILNDVLFIDRSSYYYNEVQIGDIKAFEAGVLLLCNIYKNMGCGIKAIDICKSYVRKHINAFNVFYMLGVLYLDEGDIENSFVSYISAIQLDPTHFCSFLELAKIIRHDLRFRREVIFLLRKAFLSNSRDSQLLYLLVEVISEQSLTHKDQLHAQDLLQFVHLLQGINPATLEMPLQAEIEIVYLWAAELIDKQGICAVRSNTCDSIYLALGQIKFTKGDYEASEKYYRKVLKKIESAKGATDIQTAKLELKVHKSVGEIKIKQNNFKQAIICFMRCMQINDTHFLMPQNKQEATVQEKIAYCYYQLKDYINSLAYCQKTLQKLSVLYTMPTMTSTNQLIETQKELRRKQNKFRAKFQQHRGMAKPEIPIERWANLKLQIAFCHQNRQEVSQAKKILKEILLINCSNKLALKHLAQIYYLEQNYTLCLELAEACLPLHYDDSSVINQLSDLVRMAKRKITK